MGYLLQSGRYRLLPKVVLKSSTAKHFRDISPSLSPATARLPVASFLYQRVLVAHSRVFAVTVTETVCVFVIDARVLPVAVASQVVAEQMRVGEVVQACGSNK